MQWARSPPRSSSTRRARSWPRTSAPTRSAPRCSKTSLGTLASLPELRIDPLTGLKTIVAGDRATRPGGGFTAEPRAPLDPETDPFLEGHEDRTPPEVYSLRAGGSGPDTPGWKVRVVPNLYPALDSRVTSHE